MGGVYGEIISQLFLPSLMWFPFCLLDVKGLSHQLLGFFFHLEGIVPNITVESVCL